MRTRLLLPLLLLLTFASPAWAGVPQDTTRAVTSQRKKIRFPYNSDESKVGPYTLEDPLRFADGRPVQTVADWRERRSEILALFQKEMYGLIPERCPVYLEPISEEKALNGFARRRNIRMTFRQDGTGPAINWMILQPIQVKGPAPAVILLNFYGNDSVISAPGNESLLTNFPVGTVLARGYALVTACYDDVSSDPEYPEDQATQAYDKVFTLWPDSGTTDGPRALGAWAWALMRGMDMIEKDAELDASRVVLTGCSRLGKAAVLAGAFDERFAVMVINQTGGGGVPLAKRDFGEHVLSESVRFTHWFSPRYAKYAGCEAATMPFDQHLLVSCMAPRPLLVEGFDNPWFDTRGEFLCLKAASPVWGFLGKEGLPDVDWPADYDTSAIGPVLGYVRRDQGHGMAAIDWMWLLDFADNSFKHHDNQ